MLLLKPALQLNAIIYISEASQNEEFQICLVMAKERAALDVSSLDVLLKLSYRKNEFENHEMNEGFDIWKCEKEQVVCSTDYNSVFHSDLFSARKPKLFSFNYY